jgi:hypothetical protein
LMFVDIKRETEAMVSKTIKFSSTDISTL